MSEKTRPIAWPVESIANRALTINVLAVWWRRDQKLARGVVRVR